MVTKLTFVVSLVAFCIHLVECLECYSCTDAAHVSDCNAVTQCPTGNICQARFRSNKYTLGCIDHSLCSAVNTSSSHVSGGGSGSIIGRSVTSTVQDGCSECCDTGNCNRQLCQIHSNTCNDSGTINCSLMGSVVNLCADTDHAKAVCKKFCGLCEVNGGWSSWSAYGDCSVSCGVGIQRRDRLCSSPYPSNAGSQCFGYSQDVKVCIPGACQDGAWSVWNSWGRCSKTCGGGIQTRLRSCTNPAPSALGHLCTGELMQVQQCSEKACADEKIGFSVKDPKNTSHADRIRFTYVISNEGSGYSTATGEFTCTVPGMYFFSVTIVSLGILPSPNYATCLIYKNGSGYQYAITHPYHTSGSTHYSATGTVYMHLTAGDKVSLRTCTTASAMDNDSEFTGFLVKAD